MAEPPAGLPTRAPRGRAAAIGLDKAQVVDAAVALIDERGLAAFSLRELARRLGVSPAAIYWHVGGAKEDLFAEISASITGALSAGLDASMPWDARLRQVFERYRALVHRHPAVAPLLGAQMKSNGVANLDWVETILSALQEAGYRGPALRAAFNALVGGLAGFVTMELAPAPGADDWGARFAERLGAIDPAAHPLTHAALPEIAGRIFVLRWRNGADIPLESGFSLLLELLIEGLRANAPGPGTPQAKD
ncbi:TetR/AcrR family transcriptional regulator [Rhodovulum sp. DZ06]|uniref:TetR/AcrR family transcriptional regulator n=1 Tax=Rhodovulum sp. DZ06 TaxID=3425126 RepID=UPI003D33FC01